MPRSARRVADEGIYHIINRGNGQQRVFHKDGDYLAFLTLLGQMGERFEVALYGYCLMPNHFHLLVKVARGEHLSKGMQWFTTTHVRRYHRHYQSSGHVWQGRYKSFVIEDDDQLVTVARYVEGNPVRAGLVETAGDWVWSSHRERCGLEGKVWLSPMPVELPTDWTTFVDTPLTGAELAKMKRNMERQTPRRDRLLH
ncbi:MAG: transposase [Deltaproteobacteria bacterium]|nr:transposase [Deltaproteobacteria bacterium]